MGPDRLSRRRLLAPLGLAAVLVLAAAVRAPLLGGGQIDYDEGVYWESLRAMAAGHGLFSSVYSSQPPAFLLLLLPAHLLLGGGIEGDRLAVVVLWLVGAAAAGRAAWLLAGPAAGLVAAALLVADPLAMRQSVALQADGPTVALALVGIAAAAESRVRPGRAAALLAGAAGFVLAVAVLTKLLALAALPAALVLLVGGGGVRRVAAALAGGVLATAAVLLPFAGAWPALWEQAVALHLRARDLAAGGLDAQTLQRGIPLAVLAAAGLAVAVRRAPLLAAVGVVWTIAAAAFLAVQHPLWPHHAVLLTAPLALLAGALGPLVERLPGRAPAAAAALAACVLVVASIASARFVGSLETPAATTDPVVAALRAETGPGDLVVTDDQYTAALAGRDTPPELVDTSFVRVQSGDLTLERVESVAGGDGVRAVLLSTGRLASLPGLEEWLDRRYPRTIELGDGRTLHVRA